GSASSAQTALGDAATSMVASSSGVAAVWVIGRLLVREGPAYGVRPGRNGGTVPPRRPAVETRAPAAGRHSRHTVDTMLGDTPAGRCLKHKFHHICGETGRHADRNVSEAPTSPHMWRLPRCYREAHHSRRAASAARSEERRAGKSFDPGGPRTTECQLCISLDIRTGYSATV